MSPIYLESLKTYEHLASSNRLFAEAAAKFALRGDSASRPPLEDLKRSVLRVSIPRNTKVLEIEVTLPDPRQAHAVALHLAQQAVELARRTGVEADEDLMRASSDATSAARAQLEKAEDAIRTAIQRAPTPEMLEAELTALAARRAELEALLQSSSLSIIEAEKRTRDVVPAPDSSSEQRIIDSRLASMRADVDRLRLEHSTITAEISAKQKLAAHRRAEIEMFTASLTAAREAVDDAEQRSREIQATAGYRTERLTLLDPGFVPEKPSSPSLPLNLFIAASLSLIVSLLWLTVQFALSGTRSDTSRPRLSRIAANS